MHIRCRGNVFTEPLPRNGFVRYNILEYTDHVKSVPCHHGMARPQIADVGDGLQLRMVAVNVLNT
jgi:hypothetical protein